MLTCNQIVMLGLVQHNSELPCSKCQLYPTEETEKNHKVTLWQVRDASIHFLGTICSYRNSFSHQQKFPRYFINETQSHAVITHVMVNLSQWGGRGKREGHKVSRTCYRAMDQTDRQGFVIKPRMIVQLICYEVREKKNLWSQVS